jgi:hypothetical protein
LEIVKILEKWYQMLGNSEMTHELPDDLYSIPEAMCKPRQVVEQNECENSGATKTGNQPGKWGPMLVEKRPSRRPQDGRSILEIAQDRKKKINLEVKAGMVKTKNPSHSNTVVDFASLAEVSGIHLGKSSESVLEAIAELSQSEADRSISFNESCETCKNMVALPVDGDKCGSKIVEGGKDCVLRTPPHHNCVVPQVEDESGPHGQWIMVVNRKKNLNLRCLNERLFLEHKRFKPPK